ncbi:MAG: hypothetical protein ACYT04_71565, partial [Nostoc sp.]
EPEPVVYPPAVCQGNLAIYWVKMFYLLPFPIIKLFLVLNITLIFSDRSTNYKGDRTLIS